MISRMCSHCDTMVSETLTDCPKCGHQPHVARWDCLCPKCARARRRASAPDAPAPIAPTSTEAINRLRRSADTDAASDPLNPEGSDAMPKKKTPATAAPITREIKRTPVSDDLAAKIRAVDAGLEAEFHLDFAFVILARGNVVAASNARDGVVPPVVNADSAAD